MILISLDLKLEEAILKKYSHYNRTGLLQMTEQSFIDAMKFKFHSKKFYEDDCKYGFELVDSESEGSYLSLDKLDIGLSITITGLAYPERFYPNGQFAL